MSRPRKNDPLPTISARVGERVRARREALAMSQLEVNQACGWGFQSRVAKIERGDACTLDNLNAVATVLGVELRELIP